MSYTNIYRIDPNKLDYATYYSSDYTRFGQFSSSGTGPIPPLYISPQPPQFTLIPGIINREQVRNLVTITGSENLGVGEGMALRLLTGDQLYRYGDINFTELRNRVIFRIDENDDLKISCISGAKFPHSDISNITLEGKKIVTMIFNVFDASGFLSQGQEVKLNFIREVSGQGFNIDDNTIFDIPGTTSFSVFTGNLDDSEQLNSSEYDISIDNSNILFLHLSSTENSVDVKQLRFNIVDSSNSHYLMLRTDLNFYISDNIFNINYKLTGDPSFNFKLNYSKVLFNSTSANVLFNDEYLPVGVISIYNYYIQPSDANGLGQVGGFFYINRLDNNSDNNLITLTTQEHTIGKIIRI
tara:strand:+ start:1280 stop:2344 length:1065 start_codon:yes stop_codon:yes gene_type:complete